MKREINIDIKHLSRVEGHGNITIRVKNGYIEEARWDVVETPRYFEVMLKGKHFTSAAVITSRICGICSIGHFLASVSATEDAFGIKISPLAKALRALSKHGETLQSHVLHLMFLAAPDFLELESALPLIKMKPEVVAIAASLKGLANKICDVIAGRTTHPVSIQVGGMAKIPQKRELQKIKEELKESIAKLEKVVDIFATFKIPDFRRETEYVSLKGEREYPWFGNQVISSDKIEMDKRDYRKLTNEYINEQNTSKWCKISRESFAVGALARYVNNNQLLRHEASSVAAQLGLRPDCTNPYFNNIAQLVECFQVVLDSIEIIDEILDMSEYQNDSVTVRPSAGEGVGAVEVPRGILYHHYEYDESGNIVKADCVIPTTQNNANIHFDIQKLVKTYALKGIPDNELERLCSMLVRAYDPCISCSVH